MANENGRKWHRDPRIIIPAVVVILAAIIIPIMTTQINKPLPDFSMSVNPPTGKTSPGGATQTLVTIEDIRGYEYQVTLQASEQPHGIVVTFVPIGGPTPPYSSTMTINVGSDVPAGDYTIIVKGTGADGKEHAFKYILTVTPVIPTPATHILILSINPSGSGSTSPSSGTYDSGTLVTVMAIPSPGYHFDHWSGDASGTSPSITITMNSDKSVIANFVETTQPPVAALPITIVSLKENSEVVWSTKVQVISQEIVSASRLNVYLLIYPAESNGPWWVQSLGSLKPSGYWETDAYFGRDPTQYPEDKGDLFRVIAIATELRLEPGQQWYSLPDFVYASNIIEVRRE